MIELKNADTKVKVPTREVFFKINEYFMFYVNKFRNVFIIDYHSATLVYISNRKLVFNIN